MGNTVVNLISSSSYDYFEKQVQDFYNKYELDNTISCDFKVGNNNTLFALMIARRNKSQWQEIK